MTNQNPPPSSDNHGTVPSKKSIADSTLLLSFSAEIALAQTRIELLALVRSKIKEMFRFSHCSILLLGKDNMSYEPFLTGSVEIQNFSEFETLVCHPDNLDNCMVHKAIQTDQPVFIDVKGALNSKPGILNLLSSSGINQVAIFPLADKKGSFGVISFFNDTHEEFPRQDVSLISATVRLIAIAVSHIITIEEGENREKERLLLLSLSDDLATIRDKNELLNLINTKLKRLFYFTHSVISLFNEDENTFANFLLDPGSKSKSSPDYEKFAIMPQPANDGFYDVSLASKDPVIFNLENLGKKKHIPGYVKINIATGTREIIASSLQYKDRKIGVIAFFSDITNHINEHTQSLIKGVSHQLSTAIANIIATEEIKEREQEKSALLELSKDIAMINNKNDLLQVISTKFRNLLSTLGFIIGLMDESTSTHYAYCIDQEEYGEQFPDFETVKGQYYPIGDGYFDRVLASEEPVTFPLDSISVETDAPAYVKFWQSMGFDYIIGITLRAANENIGVLWLYSEKPVNINLLKGVSAQISIAVSNILSNDDIQRREREKSMLLTFSNSIASVRSKDDLSKVINQNLKALSLVDEYIISTVSEDEGTHQAFLFDMDAPFTKHPAFPELARMKYQIADQVMEKVLRSSGPVTFEIDTLMKLEPVPPYVPFWKGIGLVRVIGVPLLSGNRAFAVLWIAPHKINDHILKGVSAQIAVAVSNILANESVQKKEAEKSILLAFSNDIAKVRSKTDLAVAINRTLRGLSLIKIYIIRIIDDDGITTTTYIYDPNDSFVTDPEFQPLKKGKYMIKDGLHDVLLASQEPLLISVEEVMARKNVPIYARYWKKMGMDTVLGSALRTGDTDVGFIWAELDQVNMEMFKAICAQISIAVSNIVANERIEQQLIEISNYKQRLEEENLYLQEEITASYSNSEIVGSGAEMQKVFHMLSQVAFTNSSVLLLGETGTGKELVARAIHNNSPRKDKLMVKVNCAAMPANLIESELFGHERGSFTGAFERRVGKFELAHKGTLFLDEIGEMPLELQVKLLRALQEREIERVGGKNTIKVDVRIIAATNRNLLKEVEAGRFRSDLYYRLNVFPITLPALRNRKEDIPVLASHFISKFSRNVGKKISNISHFVLEGLIAYNWPGNVRELEHLVERSVLLTNGSTIKEMHLPVTERSDAANVLKETYVKTIDENERDHILEVLQKCNGKVSGPYGAAVLLGVPVSTLNSKMKKLEIEKGSSFFTKNN